MNNAKNRMLKRFLELLKNEKKTDKLLYILSNIGLCLIGTVVVIFVAIFFTDQAHASFELAGNRNAYNNAHSGQYTGIRFIADENYSSLEIGFSCFAGSSSIPILIEVREFSSNTRIGSVFSRPSSDCVGTTSQNSEILTASMPDVSLSVGAEYVVYFYSNTPYYEYYKLVINSDNPHGHGLWVSSNQGSSGFYLGNYSVYASIRSGVTLPDYPECTSDDGIDFIFCDYPTETVEYKEGINGEINVFFGSIQFKGETAVYLRFADSEIWSPPHLFSYPLLPPCTKDGENRRIICDDYEGVFYSQNSGVDWHSGLHAEETFFPNSYVRVGYLATKETDYLEMKFTDDSQLMSFANVNLDVMRCEDVEDDGIICGLQNTIANISESAINGLMGTVTGSIDLFFPFNFNISERVEYCADVWSIPHPSLLIVPSFIANDGLTETGKHYIDIDDMFDFQICSAGSVEFNENIGSGDFAIFLLIASGYYGLFFRRPSRYGDIKENIILPKVK